MSAVKAPYIDCEGCYGRGFVKALVDETTRLASTEPGKRIVIREHDRCNGAGIMILREHHGGKFHYGAPQLQ